MSRRIFIDSFSGAASDLNGKNRTPEMVLEALKKSPRISTFDMSEHPWLCRCIEQLKASKLIVEDKTEPYPWHKCVLAPIKQGESV